MYITPTRIPSSSSNSLGSPKLFSSASCVKTCQARLHNARVFIAHAQGQFLLGHTEQLFLRCRSDKLHHCVLEESVGRPNFVESRGAASFESYATKLGHRPTSSKL